MDDIRVGRILRALRRRHGWTQAMLAGRCGVSQRLISLIECGNGSRVSGATMRRVFAALDARWEPTVSWRGGELDRLLDEAHARLVGEVVRRLRALRWDVAVEVTYSEHGERRSVDVLGARPDRLAVVVIEVKSELTVVEATARKADEKERIVPADRSPASGSGSNRVCSDGSSCCRRPSRPAVEFERPARGSRLHFRNAARECEPGWATRAVISRASCFVSPTNRGGGTSVAGGSRRVRNRR